MKGIVKGIFWGKEGDFVKVILAEFNRGEAGWRRPERQHIFIHPLSYHPKKLLLI
jgi:hypothetical protein